MRELRPITALTTDELYREIEAALRAGNGGGERLRLFLASIDWTSHDRAEPGIAHSLGELEGWTTLVEEGDMDETEYAIRLLSCLPLDRHVTFRVGQRVITAAAANDG